MTTLLRSSLKLPLRPQSTPHLSILLLPSHLRIRAFHASPRPQFLYEAVSMSHTLLQTLHTTTHLPWAFTLPLFAILLRTTLFLPLSIYLRRISQRQVALSPVISAWTPTLKRETIREVGHLGPRKSHQVLLLKMRAKRKEVYKRWGCQQYKNFLPVLQIPVFLSVMEAIRTMCGAHQGWFGMLLQRDTTGETETAAAIERGEDIPSALSEVIPIDPSLTTEGMLWFPSLLLPDPHLILPFVLSASILLNIYTPSILSSSPSPIPTSKFQTRLRNSLAIVALAVGPIMLPVPSALLVYWIGSSLSSFAQNVALDKLMPMKRSVEPCVPKRPWRTGLGVGVGAGSRQEERYVLGLRNSKRGVINNEIGKMEKRKR